MSSIIAALSDIYEALFDYNLDILRLVKGNAEMIFNLWKTEGVWIG